MGVKTLNELEGYRGGCEVANRQMFGHHCVQRVDAQLNGLSAQRKPVLKCKYEPDGSKTSKEGEREYLLPRLLFSDLKKDAWLRVCDKARHPVAPMMVRSSAMRSPSPTSHAGTWDPKILFPIHINIGSGQQVPCTF
jgi:hypothetical protein